MDGESGQSTEGRCGSSRKRKVSQRLTEKSRELIPGTRCGISKRTISYIRNENDVGGRARVTRDKERVLRGS